MYTLKVDNGNGIAVELTNHENNYQIIEITGLDPGQANINTLSIAGMDGSIVSNTKLNNRNIVINMKLNGNVEANRTALYALFPIKQEITLYYKTATRDVKIGGYVENITCPQFTGEEIMQISLICNYPYFADRVATTVVFPSAPGTVTNNKRAVGVKFSIEALANFVTFRISNDTTGEYIAFTADGVVPGNTFLTSDIINIDTIQGEKSLTLTRFIDNIGTINIFAGVDVNSNFFQLINGQNTFSYKVDGVTDTTKTRVVLTYANEYEGT